MAIGHFRILGIGLELACNGGSCGGISLNRVECNLHLKRLPHISLSLIELRDVQFWSEIILVGLFDFEITRMISDQIALHSVTIMNCMYKVQC